MDPLGQIYQPLAGERGIRGVGDERRQASFLVKDSLPDARRAQRGYATKKDSILGSPCKQQAESPTRWVEETFRYAHRGIAKHVSNACKLSRRYHHKSFGALFPVHHARGEANAERQC